MFEVASQIIICLILAALLGWLIGYIMGKATCANDDCHKGEDSSHELHINNRNTNRTEASTLMSNTDMEVGAQPLLLAKAREEGKDNLQLIKGVGKVLEKTLNETGIYHFDQISNLKSEEIAWLDDSMSFPGRIKREDWIKQAKDLAEGKETEFSKRVERGEVSSSKKS